ncbi:MAG: CPBP family intramembrane metalloprotease [Candidatus Lokiarchaeota archaeon]|nr:CPBP family intramembrane metalloprotease [Candidatus Lokiarchaeota archaeon]
MNEKENFNELSRSNLKWAYCPICGTKIPQVEHIKFCIKCGVDLQYINTHMRMPPHKNTISLVTPTPSSYQPYSYGVRKPLREKIAEEDLLDLQDKKLWGGVASVGITAIAYFVMNFIGALGIIIFLLFSLSLEEIYNIIDNPYFIILSSFIELILFIVPLLYVGKYLERPNFNNRLSILGFSTKKFNKIQLFKEILIGLGFAVVGVLLVFFVSFVMEVLLTAIFGFEIVSGIIGTPSEVDVIITASDTLSIILLVIIMIVIIGTSEEVLFRGFLQKGLVRSIGKTWGLLITALIFTSIHLIALFLYPESLTTFVIALLLNFFPFFAISLLLGLLYYWRKENLIAVMITHGVYNALTVILAFLVFNIL